MTVLLAVAVLVLAVALAVVWRRVSALGQQLADLRLQAEVGAVTLDAQAEDPVAAGFERFRALARASGG